MLFFSPMLHKTRFLHSYSTRMHLSCILVPSITYQRCQRWWMEMFTLHVGHSTCILVRNLSVWVSKESVGRWVTSLWRKWGVNSGQWLYVVRRMDLHASLSSMFPFLHILLLKQPVLTNVICVIVTDPCHSRTLVDVDSPVCSALTTKKGDFFSNYKNSYSLRFSLILLIDKKQLMIVLNCSHLRNLTLAMLL